MMRMFHALSAVFAVTLLVRGCDADLSKVCGIQNASNATWPWQVSLHGSSGHFCSGSLINNEWVLTAAHCFFSYSNSTTGLIVYLGRQTQSGSNKNEENMTVSQIIIHPDYSRFTHDNDIALLHLSLPVNFTDYIKPVCLAEAGSFFFNGTSSWVTGWGNNASGVSLQTLQEVQVHVTGKRKCKCLYAPFIITSNMICAGPLQGGKSSCQGDSGGPVVSEQGSVWIQSGIVSFGIGCALSNFPGLYTRVSQYQSWIKQQITTNQPGFIKFTSSGTDGDISVSCASVPAITPTAAVCGRPLLSTEIVEGQNPSSGAWPWQVSLHGSSGHFCSGSLINNEWVLTAAHCFSRYSTSTTGLIVYLGRQTQLGSDPNEVERNVSQIIIHSNYIKFTDGNDIALLHLSSPVEFTDYIIPVCLAEAGSSFFNGTSSWVTGWGDSGVSLAAPQTLQEVQVPVIGNRKCKCIYAQNGNITNNMICAGPLQGGSCWGDSGGPMVSKQGSVWIQSGIMSFSVGCALPKFPNVYTRVSQYQSWIKQQITSNQPGFITFISSGTDGDLSMSCDSVPDITSTAASTNTTTTTPAASTSSHVSPTSFTAALLPLLAALQIFYRD